MGERSEAPQRTWTPSPNPARHLLVPTGPHSLHVKPSPGLPGASAYVTGASQPPLQGL